MGFINTAICSASDETFIPSLEDCRVWYDHINREVFGGELTIYPHFDFGIWDRAWAVYNASMKPHEDQTIGTIVLSVVFPNGFKQFLNVLGHEMVHHWQWTKAIEKDVPSRILYFRQVNHGETFRRWSEKFLDVGIELSIDS